MFIECFDHLRSTRTFYRDFRDDLKSQGTVSKLGIQVSSVGSNKLVKTARGDKLIERLLIAECD